MIERRGFLAALGLGWLTPKIEGVKEVQCLRLESGDTLVANLEGNPLWEDIERIRADLERHFPERKVMVTVNMTLTRLSDA